jgi:hypothetical protein
MIICLCFNAQLPYQVAGPTVAHKVGEARVPRGWEKIDTGQGFSFYAPPGTRLHRLQGDDSSIGEIIGSTFSLQYDLGYYSNDSESAKSGRDYSEQHQSIDGRDSVIRRATFASGERWRYFSALYIEHAVYHYDYPGRWAALDIHGGAGSAKDRATVEQMFKTVKFDEPGNVRNVEH